MIQLPQPEASYQLSLCAIWGCSPTPFHLSLRCSYSLSSVMQSQGRGLETQEDEPVRLEHHLSAKDGLRRKAPMEDWYYICCCNSPLQHPSLVQWVAVHVSEDLLLCGGLTNPVPIGARRSSCSCVMGLKVKEVCAIVVHSCLSGSGWLASIGKLPFLPCDACRVA